MQNYKNSVMRNRRCFARFLCFLFCEQHDQLHPVVPVLLSIFDTTHLMSDQPMTQALLERTQLFGFQKVRSC